MLEMRFEEESDSIEFRVCDSSRLISHTLVPITRIFKSLKSIGLSSERFDVDLYSIRQRHMIIPKIISTYAKKFLQISEYDPEEISLLVKQGFSESRPVKKAMLHLINAEGRVGKKYKVNLSFHKRGMGD